ncbi:MAG: DegT/DnrJ/EryC1/StrS family aminotransferase [Planctomycetota bacterium]
MRIPAFRPCVGAEELAAVQRVFESRWLGMGEETRRFELAIKRLLGVEHVVATSKGTSALHLALDALDLEPGSGVLVPSLTFVATIQAIRHAGLRPIFCEVRPDDLNLDVPDAVARRTEDTRAVMPVHFAGEPCDIDGLRVALGPGPTIVEDAAHAFGSSRAGRPVGTLGDLTCFSFDAIKNVTCGEGGAVATDRADLDERIRRRRCLGIDREGWIRQQTDRNWQYAVMGHGYRFHMSDINAAIGLAQLEKMEVFRRRRLAIAARYDAAFAAVAELRPLRRTADTTFPFAYVVRVLDGRRDALTNTLRERGIGTMVQFIPNHLQPAFAEYRTPLPVTERLFEEIVSLPFHVEMSDDEVEEVAGRVCGFFGRTPEGPPLVEVTRDAAGAVDRSVPSSA